MAENSRNITREEISLLMDSYKAVIESNLNLIGGQEELRRTVERSYNNISEKTIEAMDKMLAILNEHNYAFKKILEDNHHKCKEQRKDNLVALKDGINISQGITDKEHGKQNVKVYGIMALMCTIILGLIGIILKLQP